MTPGFIDLHTHLDAQIGWDPEMTSVTWHGVTTALLGNCGVTFAPCRKDDREFLAGMMETVEDIPKHAILTGLPWDWESYGGYLDSIERLGPMINVCGLVGHSATRFYVMGERAIEEQATPEEIEQIAALAGQSVREGALGFSVNRHPGHTLPDRRPIPGTFADDNELYAFGDVLGRHGRGVFESAPRFEAAGPDFAGGRHEIEVLGEITRRSGRPSTFGLVYSARKPEMSDLVLGYVSEQNAAGANLRPQTTCRAIGVVLGIQHRTPWDRAGDTWRSLRDLDLAGRLEAIRDPATRAALVAEANSSDKNSTGMANSLVDLSRLCLLDAVNPN